MKSLKPVNANRIPGIVIMGTPLSKSYKTTNLKAAKELGKLLRKVCTTLRRPNTQNGPGRP